MEKGLIFEGKKFISTKRASEIYGYNPDYIGQLCREKLINAKRVGRVWFVEENAIAEHKHFGGKKVVQELPPGFLPIKEVARTTGYSTDYLGFLCRGSQVECRMVEDKWFVSQISVEQYKDMAAQKLRERAEALKQQNTQTRQAFVSDVPTQPLDTEDKTSSRASQHEVPAVVFSSFPIAAKIMFGSLVAFLIVASVFMFSSVAKQPNKQQGVVALVTRSVVNVWDELASKPRSVPKDISEGVVVVPSAKNEQDDETIKNYVKNAFSDETQVIPDETGTSGIVQPIFKNNNDQEYLYVMVPKKE